MTSHPTAGECCERCRKIIPTDQHPDSLEQSSYCSAAQCLCHSPKSEGCKTSPNCSHNTNGRDLDKPCSIEFSGATFEQHHEHKTEGWREEFELARKTQWNKGDPYWLDWNEVGHYFLFFDPRSKDAVETFISRHIEAAYERGVKESNFKCALRVIKALEEGETKGAERGKREERVKIVAMLYNPLGITTVAHKTARTPEYIAGAADQFTADEEKIIALRALITSKDL